jgi:hypothetical protein
MHKNILVGKPERNSLFGSSGHRWEDNIRKSILENSGFIWLRIGTSGGVF